MRITMRRVVHQPRRITQYTDDEDIRALANRIEEGVFNLVGFVATNTEWYTIVNALRIAEDRFKEIAKDQAEKSYPRIADQFNRQAMNVRTLADIIEEGV